MRFFHRGSSADLLAKGAWRAFLITELRGPPIVKFYVVLHVWRTKIHGYISQVLKGIAFLPLRWSSLMLPGSEATSRVNQAFAGSPVAMRIHWKTPWSVVERALSATACPVNSSFIIPLVHHVCKRKEFPNRGFC